MRVSLKKNSDGNRVVTMRYSGQDDSTITTTNGLSENTVYNLRVVLTGDTYWLFINGE